MASIQIRYRNKKIKKKKQLRIKKLETRLKKLTQKDSNTINQIKSSYREDKQDLADQIEGEANIVETFDKKDIEGLHEFLKENTITNSNFQRNPIRIHKEFNNIYSQISTIQEKQKQRITRIKIEEYLEENNAYSIEELTR